MRRFVNEKFESMKVHGVDVKIKIVVGVKRGDKYSIHGTDCVKTVAGKLHAKALNPLGNVLYFSTLTFQKAVRTSQ